MQDTSGFAQYEQATHRIADSLDRVRTEITGWIERNRGQQPSIHEIALLEGFHTERVRLVAELLAVEQRFMNVLLRRLRETHF
jgi:hypothetical protein